MSIGPASLGLEADQLQRLKTCAQTNSCVEIGEFDQDGFLLSKFGPIRGIPGVSPADFVARHRSSLKLVLSGGRVAVEKDFRGARRAFVREVVTLQRLNAAGCREHAILDINIKERRLTVPFIRGAVLREELARAGAVVRDRDVMRHPQFQGLSTGLADLKRIEAGRSVLHQVVSADFIDRLYRALQAIHSAGVAHLGIKYGNILTEEGSGAPRIIDFGEASPVGFCGSFLFSMLRDHDTEQFNLHFGTEHLTYDRIKTRLRQMEPHNAVDLGYGLSLGKPWKAASHGRWLRFIEHNLPALAGKRVLSLGSSNDFPAHQLVRLGARQVVVIEPDANRIREGEFVTEALEWSDNRRYDLQYIQIDPLKLATCQLGRFDIVFAPSCLDSNASSVIKHISTIAQVLVFQFRPGDIKTASFDDGGLAHLRQPQRLLEENGFSVRGVSAEASNLRAFIIAETP